MVHGDCGDALSLEGRKGTVGHSFKEPGVKRARGQEPGVKSHFDLSLQTEIV